MSNKEHKTTKKAYHKSVNKAVYEWCDAKGYSTDDEMGGRVIIDLLNGEIIEYHQSQHSLGTFNWATDETLAIEDELEAFIEETKRKVLEEMELVPKNFTIG